MRVDKKTAFSIFIVLLCVGSMFAIITRGFGGDESQEPLADLNTEPVNYQAQFDAKVLDVFPQIIVAGRPVYYEENAINDKLLDIQGIKKKNTSFRQAEDGNISVVITLNVVAEKKQEIISEIREIEIIEEPIEIYQSALLEAPEDVNFSNDLNQSIEYYFGATPIEGIVNINTVKGDDITVVCYASFSGQQLISATGIEIYNSSNAPQMLFSSGEFDVVSIEPIIYLQTDINSDDNQTIAILENKLKDYNFEINKDSDTLVIVFNQENVSTEIINKLFADNNINNNANKYKVAALVDTSNVVIEGKKYNYDNNQTQALLDYPEDLDKETVTLNIQGYHQKDSLLYLGLSK